MLSSVAVTRQPLIKATFKGTVEVSPQAKYLRHFHRKPKEFQED